MKNLVLILGLIFAISCKPDYKSSQQALDYIYESMSSSKKLSSGNWSYLVKSYTLTNGSERITISVETKDDLSSLLETIKTDSGWVKTSGEFPDFETEKFTLSEDVIIKTIYKLF